jgi:ATP phosphoribosyltransferase
VVTEPDLSLVLLPLMESVPQFIANKKAYDDTWKRAKLERLVLLLNGAMAARDKVGLKLNLPEEKLAELLKALPALRNPTVAHLTLPGWVAVETIIDERVVREILPQLKLLGAEGIIEYPLNKVVY